MAEETSLGPWTESHIDEVPVDVAGKRFVRALFFNCEFRRLRGATFEHCSLKRSKINPEKVEDLLSLTITLDCFAWNDVELNELAFDVLVYMLSRTRGNDDRRAVLKRMITERNHKRVEKAFEMLESLYG